MLSFLFYLSVLFDCSFQHINCRHACEDLFWVYISQSVMCRLWPRIPRRIEYRALFMTGSKKNKKENERIVCWIIVGPEQKTDIVPPALTPRARYCHFYDFSLCLSTINKRNMNFIPRESELQFPLKEIVMWRQESMNISYWSGLLNWLWNGFLNKAVDFVWESGVGSTSKLHLRSQHQPQSRVLSFAAI